MNKDIGQFTVYVNLYKLNNFALGFDFYKTYQYPLFKERASTIMLSFLFFNITITKWHTRDYFPGI